MLRRQTLSSTVVIVALVAAGCGAHVDPGPDLILTGGRIYPSAEATQPVSALAITGDAIVAIGTDEQVRALVTDYTQEMDLGGAAVLPGFHDAWVDLEAIGRRLDMLDVSLTATPRELQTRLRTAAAEGSGWIIGWGWDEALWPNAQLPDRDLLDGIVDVRPVLLYRRIGHVAWLNRAALEATGADAEVLRDPAGNPTGLLVDEALRRAETSLPAVSSDQRRDRITAGLQAAAAAGFTSVSSAPLDTEAYGQLVELARIGDLHIRVGARLSPNAIVPEQLKTDESLQVIAIGFDVDGPLDLRLAATSDPYVDTPQVPPPTPNGALRTACDRAADAGLPLDTHLRGDAALLAVAGCDAAAKGLVVGADILPVAGDFNSPRVAIVPHRMAHDMYWLMDRVGAQRAAAAHAYRDLARAGKLVALATRAPAFPLDPMGALWIMNRRQDLQGYPLDGWNAPQRLSIRDSLRVAIAARFVGRPELAIGAKADLVIWSEDPFESNAALVDARAMVVLVDGRVIYSRPVEP